MRILVIRFSSIGDIVLTSPVLRKIKETINDSEIHFLVKPQFEEVIKDNLRIQKVHLLQRNILLTIEELKKYNFDYILDLQNNLKSKIISSLLGKEYSTFPKYNLQKWLMVNFKFKCKIPHIIERYAWALKKLFPEDQLKNSHLCLEYFLSDSAQKEAQSLIQQMHFNYLNNSYGIILGATYATKRWLPEHFIELINLYQKPVILLGGLADISVAQKITNYIKVPYLNAVGLLSLPGSAALMQHCRFVLTHDTGLMHIAAALKIPIVCLWGNTVPEFGMTPYGTLYQIIENKNLSCRPCSKLGFSKCPQKHFSCMREIKPSQVLGKFQELEEHLNLQSQ
ncbi:MAG: glycosyltransferase family 9 protein [Bacteroidia bacterium]|nr:glycosyltransferase family 9 protein [Bacteroidia bacterium]MDW8158813.1 glycosyltransferase family 9 protein [Bacteroidia bacterium]